MRKILLLLLCFMFSFATVPKAWAQRTVSGTITDESGESLIGVTVNIKGTTEGTTTDINGYYSLSVPDNDAILVYSYVGFDKQEITVGSQTTIDITMAGATQLEEVVVTALGIVRKPDEITTANQVVKADEINQASNPDAVQALAGKVSGLQINTTSGGLVPATSITLRGTRSISGNNNALIVIDNVISSAEVLSTIDPNIIESINVIKGANGAALYGELGQAGALIVTTKKGARDGKFTVDVRSSVTMEEVAYLPETQNRFGQGWGGNIETVDQGSWGVPYNGTTVSVGTPDANGNFRNFPYRHIEDNILPFFDTGVNWQNSISLSGGTMESGFVNLSYQRQDLEGVIPTSNLTKNNFSITTGKSFGKLTLQTIARYTEEETDQVNDRDVDTGRDGNGVYQAISMYQQLANTPGNVPIEAFNSGDNNDHWTIYETSPYWSLQNDRRLGERRIIDLTGELSYEFTENISAVFRTSVRNIQNEGQIRRNAFVDDQFFVFGD